MQKNMDKEKLEQMLTSSSKVVGSKQVLKGISDSTVRCVIVASDADAQIKKRIVAQAKAKGVEIVYVASKKRLGESVGVEVSAAAVGIVKAEALSLDCTCRVAGTFEKSYRRNNNANHQSTYQKRQRETGQKVAYAYHGAMPAKTRHLPQRHDDLPEEAELRSS